MTDLLDQAIKAARTLPAAAQDEIARIILQRAAAADTTPPIALSPEEPATIRASQTAAARGAVATDAHTPAAPHTDSLANYFILEAFDRERNCPVLQARFNVPDLTGLQLVLGDQANDDPELRHGYYLDKSELAAVIAAFDVRFDPSHLESRDPDISLHRMHLIQLAPYLIHTGYELPLLLDGRKKLARFVEPFPPMKFDGEELYDHWVAEGILHREEDLEPFVPPVKGYDGLRTVYYTAKGEEWRIPAMKLIWSAAERAGGWNEYFERLEGMLYGYEDWQMDWWIARIRQRASHRS